MTIRIFASALLVAAVCLAGPAAGQGLPLEVVNETDAPMIGEPVSIGIPFPETTIPIVSPNQMGLIVTDASGATVPGQFKVLSRWHGARNDFSKGIKWLLVSFPANVPAASSATYYVSVGVNLLGQVMAVDVGTFIQVSTGNSFFLIDKTEFSIFKSVFIAGYSVVPSPGGGIDMRDVNGLPINPVVTDTTIEENGTVRVVVAQKGTLGALNFTCRWYFNTGRTDVTVDFRLENPGAYGTFFGVTPATVHFDSLYLDLPIAASGGTVTTTDATRPLGGGIYDLQQTFGWTSNQYDALAGFSFTEKVGFQTVNTGNRYPGAIDLTGANGGVTVTIDRFWENFPKSFKVQNGLLRIGLWPEWGNGPEFAGQYGSPSGPPSAIDPLAVSHYRFEGGRWKTYRMNFDFHFGPRTPSEVAACAERTRTPIAGRPSGYWVKETKAIGALFSEWRDWNDFANRRYKRMGEVMHDDALATPQSGLGQIGLRAFRNRGGTYGGNQFFGWDNFGDIIWGSGASSLHYDWTFSMLLRWYRGGDYGFFDVGRDMAWHKRDYDTNHSLDTNEFWRGASFYEKGWWHGNFKNGGVSHTWIHGILLHYAMTGDEGSYETALQTRDFLLSFGVGTWSGNGGARIAGWTIQNLTDCYNYLGDQACLTEAAAGIANFQTLEAGYGSNGYVLNPLWQSNTTPIRCQPWMHNIVFNAVARYTLSSGDTSYMPLMQRMMNWFRTQCLIWNGGTVTAYSLPGVYSYWGLNGYALSPSFHLLWPMLESFSYSALLFNDQTDFAWATGMFELLSRYHQRGSGAVVDLTGATWSPIAMRMTTFPASESKICGNYLLWGTAYQAVRTLFNGTYYQ